MNHNNSVDLLESNWQEILEYSYDGIWITDHLGYVLYANSAWERISGINRKTVIGKHTQDLLDNKVFSKSVTLPVLQEKRRITMMGFVYNTQKHTLTTGNPILDQDGNVILVINNVRDITDLMNLKQDLEHREKLLALQKNELSLLYSLNKGAEQGIIVSSKPMEKTFEAAVRISKFDCTVLIQGESGSGKEVIAQTIVDSSDRNDRPYIKVNCSAIPETLLESELFGYEKGAFTGADQKGKMGMFELANSGTILLDEIGDIPLNLQAKLLRVLQEKEVVRLGSTRSTRLDVRILAATNCDLEQMIKEGTFREDLYYRLNVVTITVPPLRDRKEDIPALINHFLEQFNRKYQQENTFSKEAIEQLINYHWPGNVRELRNLVENLVIMTPTAAIEFENLPVKLQRNTPLPDIQIYNDSSISLKDAVDQLETHLLRQALVLHKSTRKAASALGINQSTLVRKAQRLGINLTRGYVG